MTSKRNHKEHRRFEEIKKLSNPNIDTDMQKLQKILFNKLWTDNSEIEEIRMGKHDDVFNEEDKKEVIQIIEQDTYEMRKQRILSGIKKDIKNNFKIYNSIFGIEQKEVA